jgi:hypothetical protein
VTGATGSGGSAGTQGITGATGPAGGPTGATGATGALSSVTAFASNTTTPVVGTENFVSDVNVAGTFRFSIDTINMTATDVLEIRVYQTILTGGTPRVAYFTQYSGVQPTDDEIKVTPPIGNELTDATSLRFSIKQTFGTARAYPWKVLKS